MYSTRTLTYLVSLKANMSQRQLLKTVYMLHVAANKHYSSESVTGGVFHGSLILGGLMWFFDVLKMCRAYLKE